MNNHNLFYEDNYDIDNFLASRFSNYSFLWLFFKYLLFSQTGLVGRFQYKGRLSFLMIIFQI